MSMAKKWIFYKSEKQIMRKERKLLLKETVQRDVSGLKKICLNDPY
jgi:hypothetical protein